MSGRGRLGSRSQVKKTCSLTRQKTGNILSVYLIHSSGVFKFYYLVTFEGIKDFSNSSSYYSIQIPAPAVSSPTAKLGLFTLAGAAIVCCQVK